jgi:hypothetical protein
MFKEKGTLILTKFTEQVKDWPTFIKKVRNNVEKDDSDVI